LGEESIIGRVESIRGEYARIILLTDINSKIPVMTENTRLRGILSGDNTGVPKLLFTSSEARFQTGDMLVTSGVAGGFPGGLPVGRISSIQKDLIEVDIIESLDKLEYVKIIDYGLPNPVIGQSAAEAD
jgi:rod shape-determining protein MreC